VLKRDAADSTDTFALVAASDIVINASDCNWQGNSYVKYAWGKFNLAGHDLTLAGATPFGRAVLSGVGNFKCSDSSSMYSCVINDSVTLNGAFTITDANVTFNGVVTNADTLQNGGGLGWLTLNANGGIVNRGVIRNNPRGNALYIAIGKNVINLGIWKNSKNTLIDSVDQAVDLKGGKSIAAPFIFDGLWQNGPYQWQKNNQDIAGASRTFSFDSLLSSSSGVYRCKHDSAYSRSISVQINSMAIKSENPAAAIMKKPLRFAWVVAAGRHPSLRIQSPRSFTYTVAFRDLRGRIVYELHGALAAGIHEIALSKLAGGSYLATLQTDWLRETRRTTLIE
jgi:hypothetical protein